ncbi:pyridoxal phosphate-dependent aminotransferase [Rhodococcus sp. X156]|uniref:pyridoxal phosphate-dependent aminotransferase n=1 Tax=Rhodococcus sp. X156 TaxID=2499145 RepID=UPI000FD74063|nr:pyridoxal phosphate-dependent aminotransferase [Rhodococcus sp. X156]
MAQVMPPPQLVPHLQPFASTIFAEVTALATEHGAINLGQGFPDTDGPAAMLEAARAAIAAGHNQYAPGPGIPALRQAVAADRATRYGLHHDPDTEVLVTVGATEAITAAVLALVRPGEEVVMVEPYYDSYPVAVAVAGATRRTVALVRDGDRFALDLDALRAAVNPATRMLLVNSPHNPTGTVFTTEELAAIAELACEHDLVVLTDEVYEHLVYDGRVHRPLAGLPGMAERTLSVSSVAKTFSATGWKTGWVCGPAELVAAVRTAKQFMSFVGATPMQHAAAHALTHEQAWVQQLRIDLQGKRDLLSTALAEVGFRVHPSEASYFVCADAAPLGETDAVALCRQLPVQVGVAAVPVSVFCDSPTREQQPWRQLLRFAFCKRDDVLHEAARRLHALRAC